MTPDPEHRSSVRAHALRSVDGSAQRTYPTSLAAVGERGGEKAKNTPTDCPCPLPPPDLKEKCVIQLQHEPDRPTFNV